MPQIKSTSINFKTTEDIKRVMQLQSERQGVTLSVLAERYCLQGMARDAKRDAKKGAKG